MFYFFKYIKNHDIYKLHSFLENMIDVWCSSKKTDIYNVATAFNKYPDCINYLNQAPFDLQEYVKNIYNAIKGLDKKYKDRIRAGFKLNNNIKNLCSNSQIDYFDYAELAAINVPLKDLVYNFSLYLYNNALDHKYFKDLKATPKHHFDDFIKFNEITNSNIVTCPICGLNSLKSEYNNGRNAYDHYLPKYEYPFSSVNFLNLAPICDECNEDNKGSTDPIFGKDGYQRKAFYPYDTSKQTIEIKLQINKTVSLLKNKKGAYTLTYSATGKTKEIETWDSVFKIKERSSAVCQQMSKPWIEQIIDDAKIDGATNFETYVKKEIKKSKNRGVIDKNHLRVSFLEELERTKRLLPYIKEFAANRPKKK